MWLLLHQRASGKGGRQCSVSITYLTLSQTYLVTGGRSGDISGVLASTELLHQDASQWVYSGPLPSARDCLRGATLDNKLIITGEVVVRRCKIMEAYNHNHNVYII